MHYYSSLIIPTFYCLLIQLSQSCGNEMRSHDKVRTISIHYTVPVVNGDSSITKVENKYQKYTQSDYVMFRFYYFYDSLVAGKNLLHTERFHYFVFHKDSSWGQLFDPSPVHVIPDGRYPIDSVLKSNRIKNDRVDLLAGMSPDSVYFLPNGDKVKMYAPLPPDSTQPEPYKLYFYYTKGLQGINEKLSEKMDNEPGMTLYKIVIHSDGFYYEKFKMKFPARDYILEIKELAPEKDPDVLKYFDQYRRVVKD